MFDKPATTTSALGYTFQPVNDETIRLLTLAGSHLIPMIPTLKKYFPALVKARSKLKRKFVLTQLRLEIAFKHSESRDTIMIGVFVLVSDPALCSQILNRGRDAALMVARNHFDQLKDEQFKQLAHAAGVYFSAQIFARLNLGGSHG